VTHAGGVPEFSFGLTGRVVLVTGGVRGVGAGISSVFAEQGAVVVTCARREVEGLPYEFHSCDIRDDDAVKAMVEAIVDRHGRLDVVVNNAGGSPYVLTADASAKFNRKIIELNLIGALSVSQYANDKMQNQQHGGSIEEVMRHAERCRERQMGVIKPRIARTGLSKQLHRLIRMPQKEVALT